MIRPRQALRQAVSMAIAATVRFEDTEDKAWPTWPMSSQNQRLSLFEVVVRKGVACRCHWTV